MDSTALAPDEAYQGICMRSDIKEFLTVIAEHYFNRDIRRIMEHAAEGYQHQGMDKGGFKGMLEGSFASWFERKTSNYPMIALQKLLPSRREKPRHLTKTINEEDKPRTVILMKGKPVFIGLLQVRDTFGEVHFTVETNQPWGKLLPNEVSAKEVLLQFKGEFTLKHRPMAVLSS